MESGQAVRPIFTSIITALQQRLMLYDSRAVPPTALEDCGSRWATGIMASVNLRCRTFTLKGPHVRWRGRINTVCTPPAPTPPTAPSPMVPTSQRPLATFSPWRFHIFRCRFWSQEYLTTIWEAKTAETFGKDGRQMGPYISWVWSLVVNACWPAIHLEGTCFPNRKVGVRCGVVTLPVRTLFKSLFSAGVLRAIFESYPWTRCSENQVILFNWATEAWNHFWHLTKIFSFFSSKNKWQKKCDNVQTQLHSW